MSEEVKELVNVLKRVERKLLFVIYVKAGLAYLLWSIAIAGCILLSVLLFGLDIIHDPNTQACIITIYWIIMIIVVLSKFSKGVRFVDEIVRMHFSIDFNNIERKASKKFGKIYGAGWTLGIVIGWIIIPILTNGLYTPVGFLVFLGIGNMSIYIGILRAYNVSLRIQFIFSLAFFLAGLATCAIISYKNIDVAWSFATSIALLLYIIVSFYYISKSMSV